MLFGLPIAQILLFGFALTNEIKDSKIAICDYAHDEASQHIVGQITASSSFLVKESLLSHREIEAAFKSGDISLAVIFPNGFNRDLMHSHEVTIQVIADASDPNTATNLTNYIKNIVRDYQQTLMTTGQGGIRIVPEIRMLYNPELKGATNFVPGVMSLVLLLVSVLMTSVSIVREKENGTMEVLLVSPFNPLFVVISKAIPYFLLSLLNLTVILILSVTLLEMPFNGSVLLLYFESCLFILTCLALGLLISNATSSQQAAMLISLMGMLIPTLLLTGFMFPLENMPMPLQVVANVIPSKWYYIIVKSIMIKGTGIGMVWKETLILTVMCVGLLALSFKKFKTRLE